MLLAVLGDVSGNFPALSAVLGALDAEGIHTVCHVGDLIVGDDYPCQVLDAIQSRSVPAIQGGGDRQMVRYARKGRAAGAFSADSLGRTLRALTATQLEQIRTLPRRRRLEVDGVALDLCYGGPTSSQLTAESPLLKFERARETTDAHIIVCGGAPSFFSRDVAGTLFVAPGPISARPGSAAYVLVSTEERPWTVTARSVPIVRQDPRPR